jgi:drug/metabolite transporter (DMT)-like permease
LVEIGLKNQNNQSMSRSKLILYTTLAMFAFAGNSLLCRLALKQTAIDAASFTTVRMLSASVVLALLCGFKRSTWSGGGNWPSAVALFAYAAGFSFAYISLSAGTGALLLFGAVQATMIAYGIFKGERLRGQRLAGFVLALIGLVVLVLPGLAAPPFVSAVSMLVAGAAWGVYSLRGKGVSNPLAATAGNFLRTLPFTLALSLVTFISSGFSVDSTGLWYAALSGGLTSGIGYAIWYRALPGLKATGAATVQLSVPVLAALGGIALLGEALSWRLAAACAIVLIGITLVIYEKRPVQAA